VEALSAYDVNVVQLTSLLHLDNTTFRVDTNNGRFVLRIHRPNHRTPQEIRSEAAWLRALHADLDVVVPLPLTNRDGDTVTTVEVRGVPQARHCVLFTWVPGQFYRKRLGETALERMGHVTARLHEHARTFAPPTTFERPNVEWGPDGTPGVMAQLFEEGMAHGAGVIEPGDLATFTLARHYLEERMAAIAEGDETAGLIHADLHHGNCLFSGGQVHVIDFDDCGWGHYVYDLAVTQWYLQGRADFSALCAAHLRGYREHRELSSDHARQIPLFRAARTLLLAMYFAARHDSPELRAQAPRFIHQCAQALHGFMARGGPDNL
jgi:Ser/Thr protein kinase RdoA (MazF antagonist)